MKRITLLLSVTTFLLVGCSHAENVVKNPPKAAQQRQNDYSSAISSNAISSKILGSEYGFSLTLPAGYDSKVTGPNEYEQELMRGGSISGTQPPSLETYSLTSIFGHPLSVVIYHAHGDGLSTDTNYTGECGSQFADENLANEIVTIAGKTFLKRRQLYSINSTISVDYCFISDGGNLVTLRGTDIAQTDEAVIDVEEQMNEILATLETISNTLTGKRVLSIENIEIYELLDDKWISAEGDTLWNYHNDYQVRVTLNKNAIQDEIVAVSALSQGTTKVYSEKKHAKDADENGVLIFLIPNQSVSCVPFTATAEIDGQPSTRIASLATISSCGE